MYIYIILRIEYNEKVQPLILRQVMDQKIYTRDQ